jgi:hypothetical protein
MLFNKSNRKNKEKSDDGYGALFIPAGVLLGFGFGFLFGNLPAGMFLGLGGGFVMFALVEIAQVGFKKIIELEKIELAGKKSKKVSTIKVNKSCDCNVSDRGCSGMFYFLGFIGAAIYYISTAVGFWAGVIGFLKAIVWPVFIVFELLKFLAI